MHEALSSDLTAWSNFYVITGSSAAALTGLMFVVTTLAASTRAEEMDQGFAVYSTPTVIHFCAALLVSVILTAPWRSLVPAAVLLGIAGLYGIVYVVRILIRMMSRARLSLTYQAGLEDWLWFVVLPFAAYAAVAAGAALLQTVRVEALFALAAAAVLLIFIGIHNAWDIVTFLVIEYRDPIRSASTNEEPKREAPR